MIPESRDDGFGEAGGLLIASRRATSWGQGTLVRFVRTLRSPGFFFDPQELVECVSCRRATGIARELVTIPVLGAQPGLFPGVRRLFTGGVFTQLIFLLRNGE